MTNEEIERKSDELRQRIGPIHGGTFEIAEFARSLVAQAYGEGARECGKLGHADKELCDEICAIACGALRAAAENIRNLKDSLLPSEVSSS